MHDRLGPVALFARVDAGLNPYILLYRRALERQGVTVTWERDLGLRWLSARGRGVRVIHLHWLEAAYSPTPRTPHSRLWGRVRRTLAAQSLLGLVRFADFLTALALARLAGKWIVYTTHDLDAHEPAPWPFSWLRACARKAAFRLAHRLHVQSGEARELVDRESGTPGKVRLVPIGNYVGWYPNTIAREEARRRLGLSDEAKVLLFFGLLRPYKNVESLIAAMNEMTEPFARLLVVGQAPSTAYAEHLRRLCRDLPTITLRTEFVPDHEVQLYMNSCDACVLSYSCASSSSAVMLALSFGRPVIAPAIGNFRDVITAETGILYDPAEPRALAAAMREAARRSWSETAILSHARRYDWDTLAAPLLQLYRSDPSPHPPSAKVDGVHHAAIVDTPARLRAGSDGGAAADAPR